MEADQETPDATVRIRCMGTVCVGETSLTAPPPTASGPDCAFVRLTGTLWLRKSWSKEPGTTAPTPTGMGLFTDPDSAGGSILSAKNNKTGEDKLGGICTHQQMK